jgi:hypothetical protein
MPNWVHNRLEITSESLSPKSNSDACTPRQKSEIQQLNFQENGLVFEHYLSPKENLTGEDRINWNKDNYGCKWDSRINFLLREEDIITLEFDSPWTPPTKGVQALSQMFPNCVFELYSYGLEYENQTKVWIQKGKIKRQEERPYFGDETECSHCEAKVYPELNWDGEIDYCECPECGFDYAAEV